MVDTRGKKDIFGLDIDKFDQGGKLAFDHELGDDGEYYKEDDSSIAEKLYGSGDKKHINRARQVRRKLKKIKLGE